MDVDVIRDAEFAEHTAEQWRVLAEKALKGADFDETLVSHSDDGIAYGPLYGRRENARVLARNDAEKPWRILQRIDDADSARAAAQAAEDVGNGATGLCVVFEGAPTAYGHGIKSDPEQLDAVLRDVALEGLHIRIDSNPHSRTTAEWMLSSLVKRGADPKTLQMNFGIDPAAIFGGTGRLRMSIEALRASMPQSLSGFFALGIPGLLLEADSRPYHNAGASIAQELGAMMATATSHLRMFEEARQPLVHAAPLIGFALAVGQDQLQSIAKIRALRLLWARLQEACGIAPSPAQVHAETSMRMMTALDPETNILRNTIATFAAGVGGADTVCVLPHTLAHGLPDAFARRVARNTQLILMDESHLDHVADPAAGSGGIEHLTDAYCEAGWSEFQRIEAEGGILESLVEGAFQARVRETHEARIVRYHAGERQLVGTTLYPAKEERPVTVLGAPSAPAPEDGSARCEQMPLRRIDEALETQS